MLFRSPQTTIIAICDCCHSGTIMDFIKPAWNNRKAVSISGSRDAQTSGDTDAGGICTHSILLAIESLQRQGLQSYLCKKLFKETLAQDEAVFSSEQDITLNRSAGCMQMGIPWPLVPKTLYTAPYRRPGYMSNKTSTTTAAPADTPALAPHRLPQLHTPVAAPRPLGQVNLSMQALLSPPRVPGRGVIASAGMGAPPWVASQPPFQALPNNVSASANVPGSARHQSPSGPCVRPAWLPAGPARPPLLGARALEGMQHSSSPSLRHPILGAPSMSPQKQWALQR